MASGRAAHGSAGAATRVDSIDQVIGQRTRQEIERRVQPREAA
jgi:hypothetical protein